MTRRQTAARKPSAAGERQADSGSSAAVGRRSVRGADHKAATADATGDYGIGAAVHRDASAVSASTRATVLWQACWPYLALLAVTAVIFGWHLPRVYVLWDDDQLIQQNTILQAPARSALAAMFGGFYSGDYLPLTLLSYWVEMHLFGWQAPAQHAVNLGLHLVNVALLAAWLRTFPAVRHYAWWIAAIFALHPVQVESVAWLSERKGLLAATLLFAALLWRRRNGAGLGHGLVFIGLLTGSYLCKASGVLLPIWLLGSAVLAGADADAPAATAQRRRVRLLPEAVAVAVAAGFAWVRVQAYASSVPGVAALSLAPERLLAWPRLALTAVGFYLRLLVLPDKLSIIYPNYQDMLAAGNGLAWCGAAVLAGAGALMVFGRQRAAAATWLGFTALTLAPVLNLVPRLNFVNDRYLYLPLVGLGAVVCLFWQDLARVWTQRAPFVLREHVLARLAVPLVPAICLAVLAYATSERLTIWGSDLSLWSDTAAKNPASGLAHNNLGQAKEAVGDVAAAVHEYEQSLIYGARDGTDTTGYNNLATLLSGPAHPELRDLPRARALLERGVAQAPRPEESFVLRYNLSLLRWQQGDVAAAVAGLRELQALLLQSGNQRYGFLRERCAQILSQLEGR